MFNIDEIVSDFRSMKRRHSHNIWEPFMAKYQCDIICELGVFEGDNFVEMIAHNPKLAVAIDTWADDGVHPKISDDYNQNEFDAKFENFKKLVADKSFVQIIRATTNEAVKQFSDNFFDFVYIDADHSYEGVNTDILNWYPKVKKGKFLVGHDYTRKEADRFGVIKAVDKFVSDNNLKLTFISPSTWMVIKK